MTRLQDELNSDYPRSRRPIGWSFAPDKVNALEFDILTGSDDLRLDNMEWPNLHPLRQERQSRRLDRLLRWLGAKRQPTLMVA